MSNCRAARRHIDAAGRLRKEDAQMTIKKVTKKMAVTCKCKSSC